MCDECVCASSMCPLGVQPGSSTDEKVTGSMDPVDEPPASDGRTQAVYEREQLPPESQLPPSTPDAICMLFQEPVAILHAGNRTRVEDRVEVEDGRSPSSHELFTEVCDVEWQERGSAPAHQQCEFASPTTAMDPQPIAAGAMGQPGPCVMCGRTQGSSAHEEFRRCMRCKRNNYCSQVCQRQHWATAHRHDCLPVDAQCERPASGDGRECAGITPLWESAAAAAAPMQQAAAATAACTVTGKLVPASGIPVDPSTVQQQLGEATCDAAIYACIYESVPTCICLSIYLQQLGEAMCDACICACLYESISTSIYLSICLSIYLSICLSIYLSFYLSIFLSIYLSIYPSI